MVASDGHFSHPSEKEANISYSEWQMLGMTARLVCMHSAAATMMKTPLMQDFHTCAQLMKVLMTPNKY